MSHGTQEVDSTGLTNEEKRILQSLLKHPEVKKMAKEVEDRGK